MPAGAEQVGPMRHGDTPPRGFPPHLWIGRRRASRAGVCSASPQTATRRSHSSSRSQKGATRAEVPHDTSGTFESQIVMKRQAAKIRLHSFTELKNGGLDDVLTLVCDGFNRTRQPRTHPSVHSAAESGPRLRQPVS